MRLRVGESPLVAVAARPASGVPRDGVLVLTCLMRYVSGAVQSASRLLPNYATGRFVGLPTCLWCSSVTPYPAGGVEWTTGVPGHRPSAGVAVVLGQRRVGGGRTSERHRSTRRLVRPAADPRTGLLVLTAVDDAW